ncbi:putative actin-related protein 2/3 complex subunit 2, partial [Sesbania bispinosa]
KERKGSHLYIRIYAYTDAASCGVLDSEPEGFKSQLIFIKVKLDEKVLVTRRYDSSFELHTLSIQGIAGLFLLTAPGACNLFMGKRKNDTNTR